MRYEERSFYDAIVKAGSKLKYFHMCGNDRGKPGEDDIIDLGRRVPGAETRGL